MKATASATHRLRLSRWVLPAIIAAVLVAYLPAIRAPFEFDDATAIPGNETIRSLSPVSRLLSPPANTAVAGRPVVNVSFAINYAINEALGIDQGPAGANRTLGYHAGNIALHLICVFLLFGIVRRTIQSGRVPDRWRPRAEWFAAAVAAVWAIHPIQTDAIDYVVQRTEVLASAFYLATLYAWIRAWDASSEKKRLGWRAFAVAAALLGMGSKEVVITVPAMIVLYDRAFRVATWRELVTDARRLAFYLLIAATSAWTIAGILSNARSSTVGFGLGISWYAYLYTQAWAAARYLRLVALPDRLNFDYGQHAVSGLVGIPGALVLTALAVSTILAWRKANTWGWAGFLGAWFFLILAPSSSIIPIATEVAAERRMYLATAAVLTLVFVGIAEIPSRFGAVGSARSRLLALVSAIGVWYATASWWTAMRLTDSPVGSIVLCTVLGVIAAGLLWVALHRRMTLPFFTAAALLTATTAARSFVYTNPERLWRDATIEAPENPRAFSNLASTMFYAQPPRLAEAEALYRHAIALDSTFVQAWSGLATTLVDENRAGEAEVAAQRALAISPGYLDATRQLATLLVRRGDFAHAVPYLEQLAATEPTDATLAALGAAYLRTGQLANALSTLRRAYQTNPDRPDVWRNLGGLLVEHGDGAEAVPVLERLARGTSASLVDHGLLTLAYAEAGRVDDAMRESAVVARDATSAPAHVLVGRAMLGLGRRDDAVRAFTDALRIDPRDREAQAGLAAAKSAGR